MDAFTHIRPESFPSSPRSKKCCRLTDFSTPSSDELCRIGYWWKAVRLYFSYYSFLMIAFHYRYFTIHSWQKHTYYFLIFISPIMNSEKLIEPVETYNGLHDLSSPSYSDSTWKEKVWRENCIRKVRYIWTRLYKLSLTKYFSFFKKIKI